MNCCTVVCSLSYHSLSYHSQSYYFKSYHSHCHLLIIDHHHVIKYLPIVILSFPSSHCQLFSLWRPSWGTNLFDQVEEQVEEQVEDQVEDQIEGQSWGTSWGVITMKVKVQLSWYGPWLRLRMRLSQSNKAGLSKVVVARQIFKAIEICPYRQI